MRLADRHRAQHLQAGWLAEGLTNAALHRADPQGERQQQRRVVSDVPGVIAAGDTIDEALQRAAEALEFAAAEDWREHAGRPFPPARTVDELRGSAAFKRIPPTPSSRRYRFGPRPKRLCESKAGYERVFD